MYFAELIALIVLFYIGMTSPSPFDRLSDTTSKDEGEGEKQKEMKDMFTATDEERAIIAKIAVRAVEFFESEGVCLKDIHVYMDIEACHCNGCPLRLQELLEAERPGFVYDIVGITCNLDRKTGELQNGYRPCFAA